MVGGGAWIVPVTGVAVFMVCMIGGQLIGSAVIDQFGFLGLEVRQVGLALVLIGAVLVQAD